VTNKYTEAQIANYEERAAILEYDAGMFRADAERLARHWCLGEPLQQPSLFPELRPIADIPTAPIYVTRTTRAETVRIR
jgi:hypothetical protein